MTSPDGHVETLVHIPTVPGMGRALVNHDRRSRSFRSVDLLDPAQKPKDRRWRRGRAYDQDQTPHCVAFTGKGLVNTLPLSSKTPYRVRRKIDTTVWYDGAQLNDEWHGEDYDGTSGLGLCRYLVSIGEILEYRWTFSVEEDARTTAWVGPSGDGVWWYDSMFHPDADGRVRPTGSRIGGHEVERIGVDVENRRFWWMNSWGPDWGLGGKFYMTWDDWGELRSQDGDSFVIVR